MMKAFLFLVWCSVHHSKKTPYVYKPKKKIVLIHSVIKQILHDLTGLAAYGIDFLNQLTYS